MVWRKRVVHQEVVREGLCWLLRCLDRHGRSHNISAECCVESRSESVVDFWWRSERSNVGAGMLVG